MRKATNRKTNEHKQTQLIYMTKEQQRDELHRAIWQIANDLRGALDGWDFKSYVLGFLFHRFISENLTTYLNREEHRASNAGFDYAQLSDAEAEFGPCGHDKRKGFLHAPFRFVCERLPK